MTMTFFQHHYLWLIVVVLSGFVSLSQAKCPESKLKTTTDQKACDRLTDSRPWLKSVKKIEYGDTLTPSTFSETGVLYLFESNRVEKQHNLPLNLSLPEDSVLAGNLGSDQIPLLNLGNENDDEAAAGTLSINGTGHYSLIDIQLTSSTFVHLEPVSHVLLSARNPDSLEINNVTFFPYFDPEFDYSTETLLQVVNDDSEKTVELSINNSTFQFPFWLSSPGASMGITSINLNNASSGKINLSYANNTLSVSNSMDYKDRLELTAFSVSGAINISKNSLCNSIVDEYSQPLPQIPNLFKSPLLMSPVPKTQVIGFKNYYAWGWAAGTTLPTLLNWQEWGDLYNVNAKCSTPPNMIRTAIIAGSGVAAGIILVSAISMLVAYRIKYARRSTYKVLEAP